MPIMYKNMMFIGMPGVRKDEYRVGISVPGFAMLDLSDQFPCLVEPCPDFHQLAENDVSVDGSEIGEAVCCGLNLILKATIFLEAERKPSRRDFGELHHANLASFVHFRVR